MLNTGTYPRAVVSIHIQTLALQTDKNQKKDFLPVNSKKTDRINRHKLLLSRVRKVCLFAGKSAALSRGRHALSLPLHFA